jgi:hypothetical protein
LTKFIFVQCFIVPKLQELKYKDIYLQISILENTLNFFMHVHIMISSS